MEIVYHEAKVEWHVERGVLYVHSKEWGSSIIRISGIPDVFRLRPGSLLDINMTLTELKDDIKRS